MNPKHLKQLDSLGLKADQYAIFGSGPMAVRGLRAGRDIDVIVTEALWQKLCKSYPESVQSRIPKIELGDIEIFKDWPGISYSIQQLISESEEINGHKYVKLERVLEWKEQLGREKDLSDIVLIKQSILKKTD